MFGKSRHHWTHAWAAGSVALPSFYKLTPGVGSLFSCRDGKIGVHKIHSTFTVKYSAHEQEVNCVDCKGGIIVSGSRDRTAKVSPPHPLLPHTYCYFLLSLGPRVREGG